MVFDTVYSGYFTQKIFNIKNTGTEDLIIDSLVFSNGQFISDLSSFVIRPNELQAVSLNFSPSTEGSFTGVMKIFSNAFNDSVIEVSLKGESLNPPVIDVSKAELNFSLIDQGLIYDTFYIKNRGQNELRLKISLVDKPDLNSFMPLKVGNEWKYISNNGGYNF